MKNNKYFYKGIAWGICLSIFFAFILNAPILSSQTQQKYTTFKTENVGFKFLFFNLGRGYLAYDDFGPAFVLKSRINDYVETAIRSATSGTWIYSGKLQNNQFSYIGIIPPKELSPTISPTLCRQNPLFCDGIIYFGALTQSNSITPIRVLINPSATPTEPNELVTKQYVDEYTESKIPKILTGHLLLKNLPPRYHYYGYALDVKIQTAPRFDIIEAKICGRLGCSDGINLVEGYNLSSEYQVINKIKGVYTALGGITTNGLVDRNPCDNIEVFGSRLNNYPSHFKVSFSWRCSSELKNVRINFMVFGQ